MPELPAAARDWHAVRAEQALAFLKADAERGLTPDDAAARLARFGPNALPEPARSSIVTIFLRQFKSPLIYLLLAASAIALALGERTDAFVILVVVVANAVIGAVQEGRAERSLAALRRLAHHETRVFRAGREQVVEARDIVSGDVVLLAAGDAVTADARLIDGAALQIAEAALTGESVPVGKDVRPLAGETLLADRSNMVYAGTHVTAGRARVVVVATGLDTEIGQIAAMTEGAVEPKTPLERRVDQFGRYVIMAALGVVVVITAVGLLRGVQFVEIFMIGVSALVGMIPEGLTIAMTIALAVGVQRMVRRGAVVRRLSAVETLGSTTVICSDKTGTLTRNEMTVTCISLPDGRQVSVTGVGYTPEGQFVVDGRESEPLTDGSLRALLEAGVLCNDAQLDGPDAAEPHWKPVGDPTEIALLTVAIKAGIIPAAVRARFRRRAEVPFDAAVQMMATQHDSPDGPFVVIKGAPEALLESCGLARHRDRVVELTDDGRQVIRAAADAMASRALRLLAVAVSRDAEIDVHGGLASLKGRLTLLGIVGEIDPPRVEVAQAVKECWEAGIRPVVVTGDHKATALAIARELGIARQGDTALDGAELAKMSDAELAERISGISVFARVHPAQKLRIVEAYQKRPEVVAMTGDGVNDAPALVRADVGIAMGITGTEVAKDAAKIVIADDNFATIVAAVKEGRVVYRNIKKAVLLLFSTSFAEVIVLLLAMLLGYPPPFAAVQILWNNLVTEGVVTVNLIMEPAEGDEMRQPPTAPSEPLLTRILLMRMSIMVVVIVASTLGWFVFRTGAGVSTAQVRTETFTLLAICEWFNVLNCRSELKSALNLGLFKNLWLLGGLVVGILLQVAVVSWPVLGAVFRTVPLGLEEVFALSVVGSSVLWTEEARKLVQRLRVQRRATRARPN